jgi:hypothetical protein
LAEQVTFVRGHSHRVALPEPVDLVICDHVGYFGFDYGIIHTLQDARRRFVRPGGRLIPAGIRLYLGAVESRFARDKAHGWAAEAVPPEFHWLRDHTVNTKHGLKLAADTILGPPASLGDIDLHVDQPDFFAWTAEFGPVALRAAVIAGVAMARWQAYQGTRPLHSGGLRIAGIAQFRGQFTQLREQGGTIRVGSCNPAPVHSDIRLTGLR